MEKVTEKLSNGNEITYNRLENGTCYHEKTNMELVKHLEAARVNDSRVRLFYGHEDGKDWHEENDLVGRIGRSTGRIKIPLIINNSRSMGGPAILDQCIVKLMVNGAVKWEHPNYYNGTYTMGKGESEGYEAAVYIDGVLHAQFKTKSKAERWIDFMNGKRGNK